MHTVPPESYECPEAPPAPQRSAVSIAGTPVDRVTRSEAVCRIDSFVRSNSFHQVATANTDFLVNSLEDAELANILRNADLVTADGMPVVWAAKLLGSSLPERVTGADIVPDIARLAAKQGYRLFLLGSQADTLERAAQNLCAIAPGLQISGLLAPPFAAVEDLSTSDILSAIRAARPHILLVAFGNPKQEKWIYRNRVGLSGVPVCMGVGATFEFIAGSARRAPRWMQKCGLEWLHRLANDPKRLMSRYSRDFTHFTSEVWREYRALRALANLPAAGTLKVEISEFEGGACLHLRASGSIQGTNIHLLKEHTARCAAACPRRLSLDLTEVTAADAEGAAQLLLLQAEMRGAGIDFHLTGISTNLAAVMRLPSSQTRLSAGGPITIAARIRRRWAGNPISS
jgi:N-acetylglucosaminyldiphosphoundecaprenol N-acetyl-beta-D-mannosaminyltransferase